MTIGNQDEDTQIKQTSLFRFFFVIAYALQSAWPVLLDLATCVRQRSWTDLPCTLSKLQLGSPRVADSQVSSKWLPLLAVSPLSPTCWYSVPTSHFSLMTASPQHLACSSTHAASLLAATVCLLGSCPGQCCPLLHPEKLLTHRRTVSGQRPCQAKCLGGNSICPGCFASGFLSHLCMPWHIFCRHISSEHRGCPASPSHLSCAWLAAHSQPWCRAKSSHRDFWTDTLLSPGLEHPLVLPVAPACLHIIYGPALPASLRVSCTEVRESHTGCIVWSVGCLCNHRPAISMETAAGVSGAGSVAIPGLAFQKSVSMFCWEPCLTTVYYHVLPGFSFWILWLRSSKLHPGRALSAPSCSTCPSPVTRSWVITGISQTLLCLCTTHKLSFFKWKWICLKFWLYPSLFGSAGSFCLGSFSV